MSSHESLGEAYVTIRGDGTKFPADIDSTVTGGVTEVVKKGAKILGGLVIAAKLKDQFKEGLAELEESLAVAAQTTAVIASTGGVAGVTAGHVSELAGALLEVSGADDELIAKGETILLGFTDVRNAGEGMQAIFDRATVAGLDLATRGFGSVESNAKLLGLALSDPEAGLTKLRKAGILLTDQQIAAIDAFTQVGDLLGAQGVILDAIEGKVGGAAAAYGETLPGKLKIAQESLTNLKAELVSGAAPAIELFADSSKVAVDAIEGLPDPIKNVIGGIGALAFVAGGIVQPLAGLSNIMSLLAARRAENAAATVIETGALSANTGATLANVGAQNSAASVSGLYETKTGSLAGALGKAGIVAAAAAATYGMYAYGQSLNKTALDSEDLTRITRYTGDQLISGMDELIAKSKGPFAGLFDDAIKGLTEKGPEGIGVLTQLRDHYAQIGDQEHLGKVNEALKAASDSQAALTANAKLGADAMITDADALEQAGKAADGFSGFIDKLTGAMDDSYAASGKWYGLTLTNKDLLVDYEGNVDSLTESLKKNTLTTDIHTAAGRDNYQALRTTGESIVNLIKNHVQEGATLEEAIQWGDKYVGNLRAQLQEAGYNEQQISDMIAEINLTPTAMRTEFSNNTVAQQLVIGEFLAQLDSINNQEYKAQIRAEIEAGEFANAKADLDALAAGRVIEVDVDLSRAYHDLANFVTSSVGLGAYGAIGFNFDTGGSVNAPRGQAVAAIVHGGEYVMNTSMVDAIKAGRGWTDAPTSQGAAGSGSAGPAVGRQYNLTFPTLPADATLTPERVGTVLRRIEALAGG